MLGSIFILKHENNKSTKIQNVIFKHPSPQIKILGCSKISIAFNSMTHVIFYDFYQNLRA